ncbi:hypothetical protein [Okeania sp. SIO2B3]|uniref:hypothetical protein n=1 Tax=Okeania sp. SIO2B3 TaxID=2607784 RepID=UPI0013BFBEAD|nr:hypothetical protein [Okeania sp. SIO2B3]NET44852.1 hypothetical protein [Okeania sp. SIO2B3]
MNNWQSRKASIRPHQLSFLRQIADEMEFPSISDAVDYVINEYKKHRLSSSAVPTPTHIEQALPAVNLDNAFGSLDLED